MVSRQRPPHHSRWSSLACRLYKIEPRRARRARRTALQAVLRALRALRGSIHAALQKPTAHHCWRAEADRRPGYASVGVGRSAPLDVGGVQPLLTSPDLELDFLPFREGLEAVHLNRREVDEHVLATLLLNEAVALGIIEPLHLPRSHTICLQRSISIPAHAGCWASTAVVLAGAYIGQNGIFVKRTRRAARRARRATTRVSRRRRRRCASCRQTDVPRAPPPPRRRPPARSRRRRAAPRAARRRRSPPRRPRCRRASSPPRRARPLPDEWPRRRLPDERAGRGGRAGPRAAPTTTSPPPRPPRRRRRRPTSPPPRRRAGTRPPRARTRAASTWRPRGGGARAPAAARRRRG